MKKLAYVLPVVVVLGFSLFRTAHAQFVNYDELWMTPGQTVQLIPSTGSPTSFTSQSSTVATVSVTGTVYAVGLGDGGINVTVGDSTELVLVHVQSQNDTPNFGNDGSINTSYVPGKSIFVTSLFESLSAANLATYGAAWKQAGINTLESGFYIPPNDGGNNYSSLSQWEAAFNSSPDKSAITSAIADGFDILLTGDSMVRGGDAVYDACCSTTSTAWSTDPITYAMSWAAQLGHVIGVEMDDEITSAYAVPTVQGQLGQQGGPQSITCVNNVCTVSWPVLNPYYDPQYPTKATAAVIGNGAHSFVITGSNNPNLNNSSQDPYVENVVNGGAFQLSTTDPSADGFSFDATGVGTQTITAATDPNLTFEMYASGPQPDANGTAYIPNDAFQKIMSYIRAAVNGGPNITWPAAALVNPGNFGVWAEEPFSDYADMYYATYNTEYGNGEFVPYDIFSSAVQTFTSVVGKYPWAQKNKPILFEAGDTGPGYDITGVNVPVSSFDGNTLTLSSPSGITSSNLVIGLTRLTLSGASDAALNGDYYVYNVVNPSTVQVFQNVTSAGTNASSGVVTFNDGQIFAITPLVINVGGNNGSLNEQGFNAGENSFCVDSDNFGATVTVASSSIPSYDGTWYLPPAAALGLVATPGATTICGFGLKMFQLNEGQSSAGGTASVITTNNYQPGISTMTAPATSADNAASNVMLGAERGFAGIRMYQFQGNLDAGGFTSPSNCFTETDCQIQQGANPFYNGPSSIAVWQGVSNGYNLAEKLAPYLLEPKLNSPDYGPVMSTAARISSYGTLLMMTNFASTTQSVAVNLAPYNIYGTTGVEYLMDGEISTSNSISGVTTNVSLIPGETAAFTFPASGSGSPPSDTTPPTVPTGLMTTLVTTSTVSLSWTPSTDNVGVVGYKIYRGGTQVGTSTATSFTNTGLAASTTYSYTVSAYDAAGNNSAQSAGVSATTKFADTTPPTISLTAPANNAGVSGSVTVTATASDNIGVTSVQFKLDGTNIGVPVTAAPYQVFWNTVGSTNGTHTLSAVASDAAGNTAAAPTVTVTVNNVTVVKPVVTSVLSATATANSLFSYQITASNNPTSFSATGLPAGLAIASTTGLISGAPAVAGASNITLSATNSAGTGSAILVLTVTNVADITPPSVPTNLAVTGSTTSTVSLAWTASTDNFAVAGYKIYRAGTQVGTSTITSFTNTGLAASTTYSYTVSAYDAAGNNSAQSAGVSAKTQSAVVQNPTSTPPSSEITDVIISSIDEGSAQLTITLPTLSSVTVRYGLTTAYENTTVASPYLTTVFENLTGLTPATVYDFIVIVIPQGTTTPFTSQNYIFTTLSTPPAPAPTSGGGSSGGGGGGGYILPVVSSTSHPSSVSSTNPTSISVSSGSVPGAVLLVFPRNLAFGDTGPDVALLQTVMKNLGFFNATTTITQTFGQFTEHAVLLFQSAHDLNMSGFLDTQTQTLLDKVVTADPSLAGGLSLGLTTPTSTPVIASSTTPTIVPAAGASFTKNLAPGSTGSEVTLLQQTLFTDGDYPQDIVSGYYGSLTETAVKAFQAKYGIIDYGSPATTGYGAVGPKTRKVLNGL